MYSSIKVSNNSGADQTVAVLATDSNQPDAFPLVWRSSYIPDGANSAFKWDRNEFGLGWGTTNAAIAYGEQFTLRQVKPIGPIGTNGATNRVLLKAENGTFKMEAPYFDSGPNISNKYVVLSADKSFEVSTAKNARACIALFLNNIPIMAQPLAPSTDYYFAPGNVTFYLTVTSAKPGTAVPHPQVDSFACISRRVQRAIALSGAKPVVFPPGVSDLAFNLTQTLAFEDCT